MKNSQNKNYPAFSVSMAGDATTEKSMGLTKREYFAGLAMQAIISNQELRHDLIKDQKADGTNHENYIAFHAVNLADKLLIQLEK